MKIIFDELATEKIKSFGAVVNLSWIISKFKTKIWRFLNEKIDVKISLLVLVKVERPWPNSLLEKEKVSSLLNNHLECMVGLVSTSAVFHQNFDCQR